MTPCIEWPFARSKDGYGQAWVDGRVAYMHRVAWQKAHGPIPDGMCVLHRCDNPPCMNVDHLFLGTKADNNRDMRSKGRSRVPHYSGERNPASKLTQAQVEAIRADDRILREVAVDYGVHLSTIQRIRRQRTWGAK